MALHKKIIAILLAVTLCCCGCDVATALPDNPATVFALSLSFDVTNQFFEITLNNRSDHAYRFATGGNAQTPVDVYVRFGNEELIYTKEPIRNTIEISANGQCVWRVPWQYKSVDPTRCSAHAELKLFSSIHDAANAAYVLKSPTIALSEQH